MPDSVFVPIAHIDDPATARILVSALQGYGFHPMARENDGLPGMPGIMGPRGVPVEVPQNEAADARALAESLLADMRKR